MCLRLIAETDAVPLAIAILVVIIALVFVLAAIRLLAEMSVINSTHASYRQLSKKIAVGFCFSP